MTEEQFNRRYPNRLKKVAHRAQTRVIEGLHQHFQPGRGQDLRLVAYFSGDNRGQNFECDRVLLEPVQTRVSLSRILLAIFTQEEAERVYAVWQGQLYEDTRITVYDKTTHAPLDRVPAFALGTAVA